MNGHLVPSRDSNGNDHDKVCETGVHSGNNSTQHQQLPSGLSDLIQKALDQLTDLQEAMEEEDQSDDDCGDHGEMIDVAEEDAALMGFRFCAEETIRFLIEEEHFLPDDPIIRELQQHLNHQQVKLQQQIHDKQDSDTTTTPQDEENDVTIEPPPIATEVEQQESASGECRASNTFEMDRHDTAEQQRTQDHEDGGNQLRN